MRPRIAHRMYPSPCTNRPPLRSKRSTAAPVVPVVGRLVTDPLGDRAALGRIAASPPYLGGGWPRPAGWHGY
jgi:hypothetical protein